MYALIIVANIDSLQNAESNLDKKLFLTWHVFVSNYIFNIDFIMQLWSETVAIWRWL